MTEIYRFSNYKGATFILYDNFTWEADISAMVNPPSTSTMLRYGGFNRWKLSSELVIMENINEFGGYNDRGHELDVVRDVCDLMFEMEFLLKEEI